jgi:hypothetical protein
MNLTENTLRNKFTIGCLFLLFMFISFNASGQEETRKADSIATEVFSKWLLNLYEPGFWKTDDSLYINKDGKRILNDEIYRQHLYPTEYSWEKVAYYVDKQQLKISFWHIINLYYKNDRRDLAIKAVLTYDKILKMEEVLTSTFYTYCYTDPEVGEIINGFPEISNPQILDQKLNALKELISYMNKYKVEQMENR